MRSNDTDIKSWTTNILITDEKAHKVDVLTALTLVTSIKYETRWQNLDHPLDLKDLLVASGEHRN